MNKKKKIKDADEKLLTKDELKEILQEATGETKKPKPPVDNWSINFQRFWKIRDKVSAPYNLGEIRMLHKKITDDLKAIPRYAHTTKIDIKDAIKVINKRFGYNG